MGRRQLLRPRGGLLQGTRREVQPRLLLPGPGAEALHREVVRLAPGDLAVHGPARPLPVLLVRRARRLVPDSLHREGRPRGQGAWSGCCRWSEGWAGRYAGPGWPGGWWRPG